MLGGVPGVAPAKVVIIGGGVVGENAAYMAIGLGADVTILDRNIQTLRDLVPIDVAKELTFTGRILDSEEAKALGLITHLAEDPHARAMDLAREIASRSPDAIRSGKRLLEETWHTDERTALELETKLQVELIGSENQLEAIRANFEKRAPEFKDAK